MQLITPATIRHEKPKKMPEIPAKKTRKRRKYRPISSYPDYLKDYVSVDYWRALTNSQKRFLLRFTDGYYGKNPGLVTRSGTKQSEIRHENYAAEHDCLSKNSFKGPLPLTLAESQVNDGRNLDEDLLIAKIDGDTDE